MDHFALETDSLWKSAQDGSLHRNFMGYTSRQVSPLIGLGVSSIGDLGALPKTRSRRDLPGACRKRRATDSAGSCAEEEDRIVHRHVLNLMTLLRTDWREPALSTPYLEAVPAKLQELEKDGLLHLSPGRCEVTVGRPFIRNICMAFDARLGAAGSADTALLANDLTMRFPTLLRNAITLDLTKMDPWVALRNSVGIAIRLGRRPSSWQTGGRSSDRFGRTGRFLFRRP